MDLQEIEVFLTLAEELHFGRTAERLRLSQPRVSQLIRSLERRVGGRLFERTSRRVSLTPLGERLRDGTDAAYAHLHRGIADAHALAQGLRIGALAPLLSAIEPAAEAFRALYPLSTVTLSEVAWLDLYGPLRRAEIDVLVTLLPVEEPDLTVGPVIAEYPRMVAVGTGHPLSGRARLTLEDLAGHRVITPPPEVPQALARGFWPPLRTPSGRPIPRGRVVRTQQEMLSLVAQGEEFVLTSTAVPQRYRHSGVIFVPIDGLPPACVVLVWRTDTDKIRNFAGLATRPRPA